MLGVTLRWTRIPSGGGEGGWGGGVKILQVASGLMGLTGLVYRFNLVCNCNVRTVQIKRKTLLPLFIFEDLTKALFFRKSRMLSHFVIKSKMWQVYDVLLGPSSRFTLEY